MSVNANLNQITFQSSLRSKPVRENFTDTENALNDLQSQINALATPPAGTEVTNARDNHTVLRDRLRSESMINGNVLISGGVVEEQAIPDMTVHITAGEAIVDGVACKWAAQDSGTITAPVSNTRLDYVVVNSDNSISIVAGTASASPVFPPIASSQLVVCGLVVKAATTSMNERVQIFNFRHRKDETMFDFYLGADGTLYRGKYKLNNVIIDADYEVNCADATGIRSIKKENIIFSCYGNYYLTAGSSISVPASHAITKTGIDGIAGSAGSASAGGTGGAGGTVSATSSYLNIHTTSYGNAGGAGRYDDTASSGGGGGGGGASTYGSGGAGGVGGYHGTASGGGGADGAAGTPVSTKINPCVFIYAYKAYIDGDILLTGLDGGNGSAGADLGSSAGGGGAGGSGGGSLFVYCRDHFDIAGSIDVSGGNGGNGGAASTGSTHNAGGGGGGGGAGGIVQIRSLTYSNTGSIVTDSTGGAGGVASGTGASNGVAGSDGLGLLDQELFSDYSSELNSINQFNNYIGEIQE